MTMDTIKVFVYGTLKVGGRFAVRLNSRRISATKATLRGYDLFSLWWFPGIIAGDGIIHGELHEYKDPKDVIKILDGIEGYSEDDKENSLYLREEGQVMTTNGDEIKAAFYVFNRKLPENAEKIASGEWEI